MAKEKRYKEELNTKERIKLLEIQVEMLITQLKELKTTYLVESFSYRDATRLNE